MAKIRRVIRKVHEARGEYFDEHLWPVYIALVVLGGFLMGVSAAYQPLSGVPWYETAWTSLIAIPLAVVAFMVAFRYIDNRFVRRSLQLSVVICAILHVALVVQLVETEILGNLLLARREPDEAIVEPRPKKLIPEYPPDAFLPEEDRPRQDFERPLETRTPEPDPRPEEIVRQPLTEEPKTPPEPQPVPVPENVATAEPNVIRRNQPNEVAPRQAEEGSKLSRQTRPSELKISQLVDTPSVTALPTAGIEARASTAAIERRVTEAAPATREASEPTTTLEATTAQVARRTESTAPTPETAAQPTLRRQVAQPAATPRTDVAATDALAAARETSPTALSPANTAATRQTTTIPQLARALAEPVPEITRAAATAPQRRESPAAEQARAVASTPSPVANRQPRATARPDVATTAANVAPTAAPSNASSAAPQASLVASRIERATTEVASSRTANISASEPRSANTQLPAALLSRAGGREGPTVATNPTAVPTLTRASGAPSLPAATQTAEAATGAIIASSANSDISPASTATRRQATEIPTEARSLGDPAPSQVASTTATPTSTPALVRRSASAGSAAMDSPVTAAQSGLPTSSRSTENAVANVVTIVGNVPANAGPQVAGAANPGPSSATVSRQSAPAARSATMTQPALSAQVNSPASQLAGASVTRAATSRSPAIDAASPTTGTPRRALAAAGSAASPVAVENPAGSVAAAGTSPAAADPGRMALARGQAGIAGGGESPNIDSSLPGGNSPALTASGAARRTEATQHGPPGDALSPSSQARVARSRAGADSPTAVIVAQSLDTGTTGGSTELAEATASSGAALTRADSSAERGATSAAKGTGEVDLGPTQTIAEAGVGRSSGGGQPQLNVSTQSPRLARQTGGGSPQMSLAAAEIGAVAAPTGTASGQPAASEAAAAALAAVRTVAGGEATASGGPSKAELTGPLAEVNTSPLLADSNVSRNDNAAGASGGESAAGEPGLEDEEEKARRLARAALGGAPQLALAGPIAADVSASPTGEGGDGGSPGATPELTSAAIAVARSSRDGGAPVGGAPLAAGEPEPGGRGGAEVAAKLTIARAEATDGAPGEAELGSGTNSPARAAAGPTIAASTRADNIVLAGAPASSGASDGAPLAGSGIAASRLSGGAQGPITGGPVGALAGPEVIDARVVVAAGESPGRRQASPAVDDGPAVAAAANTGAAGRRAATNDLVSGSTRVDEIPVMGSDSAVAQADMDHVMGGAGSTPMSKQTGDALAVNIEAPEGPGGLGTQYTPQVGINTRQARQESLNVQLRSARFVKTNVGGLPSVSTSAIATADAFSSRGVPRRGDQPGGGRGAPGPQTEEAIDRGLAFLARYQAPDGGWSLQGFPEEAQLATDTAATALAIIAFQGAGYSHREHQYKEVVRSGLDFLVKSQKENGDMFVPLDDNSNRSVWLYSHSLAALALCEAYGMTQDPDLKAPAQKALDFIVASQDKKGGGWRYSPGVNTDTSVTGWMMMALKSGELAGLSVPRETYAGIQKWLDASQQSATEPHLYRYNPFAPDTPEQRHGRKASKTMTAVGLLMRLYSGWRRDNANLSRGADFLAQNLPAIGTPRQPERDTYYWYYGTQVMFHMGGEHWQRWNAQLHPLIVGSQVAAGPLAGSWEPKGPVPDRWGPHGGRLYVTTLNLLSLEVFYRHLPLYEDTAR